MKTPRLKKHTNDRAGASDQRHLMDLYDFAEILETENIHLRAALERIGKLEFGLNHHSPAIVAHEALEALK